MLRVSIIINTLNRRSSLERTLESLCYLRHPQFEVVCVNGPSNDGTDELLEKWRSKIKVVLCPEANLSRSRNLGIQHAAGDIVCFIDDDAIPESNWLSAIEAAYDDPHVAAVGGYIRDHTGVSYQAKHLVCDRFADVFDGEVTVQHSDTRLFYTALTGTNCSFRRDALVKIGGFDEVYAYFLDETDVLIRLHDSGYGIVCIEGAEVHHKYAPSSMRNEKKIAKTLYYPVRSKVYYAYRHALPVHNLGETVARLDHYIDHVAASQDWLCRAGEISVEHHAKLQRDIDNGRVDGLKLAFHAEAPFVRDASFFKAPPAFTPFSVKKPSEERLKLCFISQDYLPRPNGGIGIWVGALAHQLAALGHEVTVITRTENAPTIDFEGNVWVHRIQACHWPQRPFTAPENLPQTIYDWSASAYAELLKVALMRGVDLASAPIWDVEGIVAHCAGTIPVALSLHTSYGLALPSKPQWQEDATFLTKNVRPVIEAEKMLFDMAPLVFANSQAIINDLERCYNSSLHASRLALIPHGLRDECPSGMACLTSSEAAAPTVLFVGRFEERKGIDVLLAVIPAVLAEFPDVRFVLVGRNDISPYWTKFTERYRHDPWFSRVEAPGFVSRAELTRLYKNCTIFVAPSRYESFGLIYLEAMMWGKPCIGTTAGGIPEVVRERVTGLVVTPGAIEELQCAITTLLEQDVLRKRLGEKARVVFEQEYTDTQMAKAVECAAYDFVQKKSLKVRQSRPCHENLQF